MAFSTTPQITATITISSPNLLNDSMALSVTNKLYKAGTAESIDQTTGVARKSFVTVSDEVIFAAADYTDSKAHKVYIKNTSSNTSDFVTISIDEGVTSGTYAEIGLLYGGDWAFIPWSGEADFVISTNATITVEYALFHEG